MTLTHPCGCLSALDRRDGRRCEHDSWGERGPAPDRHWATPHRDLPLPLLLLAAIACGVLFAALLLLGQDVVCAVHEGQHPICPGYVPTDLQEPRP